jgi:polyhydroxybutyrate depolymerase
MTSIVRALGAIALALGAHVIDLPAQSAPATASPLAGGPRTLQTNGETRRYLLHVPASLRRGQPAPLVLVFHGGGGNATGIAPHTGFSALADREGFVVAYPQGVNGRWNDGRGLAMATHDDVGFVRALLDTLGHELGVDPRRVYATGISNGAMFAYRLACDLPGTFAAIAPVAGAMPADLVAGCERTAPTSVIAFQGTEDPLMPYAGGGVARRRGRVLSAERSLGFWATVAGCGGQVTVADEPDRVTDGTRVRRTEYGECRAGREVTLYAILGGGHTWPGGPPTRHVGRVSREIEGTRVVWEFFARHPRPE